MAYHYTNLTIFSWNISQNSFTYFFDTADARYRKYFVKSELSAARFKWNYLFILLNRLSQLSNDKIQNITEFNGWIHHILYVWLSASIWLWWSIKGTPNYAIPTLFVTQNFSWEIEITNYYYFCLFGNFQSSCSQKPSLCGCGPY